MPAEAFGVLKAAAKLILEVPGVTFQLPSGLPLASSCTDGLLALALEAIDSVIEEPRPTTRVLYLVLSQLVGAALVGAAAQVRLSLADAEKAGRRLHKQAVKVQRALAEVSSKAARERELARQDAAEDDGLQATIGEKVAASEAEEQASLHRLRCAPYNNFSEITEVQLETASAGARCLSNRRSWMWC